MRFNICATRLVLASLLGGTLSLAVPLSASAQDTQSATIAYHTTIVPAWFNPSEFTGGLSPFSVYYAIHDALVKPMPEGRFVPSLAESVEMSEDGLNHVFKLGEGLTFHNGEPLTAEDVVFTYERYEGAHRQLLHDKIRSVEAVDDLTVRITLNEPWPDFMLYYGGLSTSAGWILPKDYITEVGEAKFKQEPIGAGPYKVASHVSGSELRLEAFDNHWRKKPAIQHLTLRMIPDQAVRGAALVTGETDISFVVRGIQADQFRNTPGITLVPMEIPFLLWITFPEQWDDASPWSDPRVRQAVIHAVDREEIGVAEYLGYAKEAGSIVPPGFEFASQYDPLAHDPEKARQLLAEAGYPDGFDGGTFTVEGSYSTVGEAIQNDLQAVGIRTQIRTLERAPFYLEWAEKKLNGIFLAVASTYDNAATYLDQYVTSDGARSFGTYPEIDELLEMQGSELDAEKRTEILARVQDIVHEKVMFAPLLHASTTFAHGPRVEEPALGLIQDYPYLAPFEDLRLKAEQE